MTGIFCMGRYLCWSTVLPQTAGYENCCELQLENVISQECQAARHRTIQSE